MKIRRILIITLSIIAVVGALIVNAVLSKNKIYNKIIYKIEYQTDPLFSEKELDDYIKDSCGIIIGKKIKSINLHEIEKKITRFPYLESVDVMANSRGYLVVKGVQHKVIARVFNKNNESFYISQNKKILPLSSMSPGRVLIVSGEIYYHYTRPQSLAVNKNSILFDIWTMANYIEKDLFLKSQIGQIYINLQQEIELVPTVGNHIIVFGKIEDMEEKFNNLKYIYNKGFRITGWDKYSVINLKFGNQIPCEKR